MGKQHQPVLLMQGIRKTFGDTVALDNVEFDLYAGEVHCLVGENGAGKSTLIKLLSGAERPDKGFITVFGKRHRYLTPDQSLGIGIATIYQDVELIGSLSVADNIFLGNEIRTRLGTVDFEAQNREARRLMDSLHIDIPEKTLVERLAPAEQQTLQIVKALHINARILIMDEPTASLGMEETEALMNLIRQLTSEGIGIIYISHYLEEVFQIGDRITVLKDGRVVNTLEAKKADVTTITTSMIGRERSLFYERERGEQGHIILEVRNLSRRGVFEDVSFNLRQGEILGFGGIVGAGRSELMNVLFGAEPKDSGEIRLRGKTLNLRSPCEAIGHGLAMIPEDRKLFGLFDLRSVLENITVVRNHAADFILDYRSEKQLAKKMVDRLRIVVAGLDQPVGYLSGGNQQKTIIARWLLSKAEVFIFDEPTKGVDIGAKEQIYELMVQLSKQGKGILMVSSDMPELMSMSDRIAIMREGRLVRIVDSGSVTEHELLGHFLGIEAERRSGK